MSFENKIKGHVSLKLNKEVADLCLNFFRNKPLKINHINYIQRCDDGTVLYLCSNHDWLLHYYTKNYGSVGAFEQNTSLVNFKYVLWNSLSSEDAIIRDSRDMIGIEHGITIVDRISNGFGFYNLGTTNQSRYINNEYINHLELLNEFISVFKEKANPLITKTAETRFIIPAKPGEEFKFFEEEKHRSLRKQRGLYLGKLFFYAHLTDREIECLNWCVDGLTVAEIAEKMHVSIRTAQTHIENIKSKLGCRNMFQLGYMLAKIRHEHLGYM